MSTATPHTVAQAETVAGLARAIVLWVRNNSREAVVSAVTGAAIGYAANVLLMWFEYRGHVFQGGLATTRGNLVAGTFIWALASTIGFTLFGYWRTVGTKRFLEDVIRFPSTLAHLLRQDGHGARKHLLWGAAISLLGTELVSPWLGAVLAVGMVLALPSLLGRILAGLLYRAWFAVVQRLAPNRGQPLATQTAMTVGLIGTIAALAAGFFIESLWVKLGLAAACVALALIPFRIGPAAKTVGLGLMLLMAGLCLARAAQFPEPMYVIRCETAKLEPGKSGGPVSWVATANPQGFKVRPGYAKRMLGGPYASQEQLQADYKKFQILSIAPTVPLQVYDSSGKQLYNYLTIVQSYVPSSETSQPGSTAAGARKKSLSDNAAALFLILLWALAAAAACGFGAAIGSALGNLLGWKESTEKKEPEKESKRPVPFRRIPTVEEMQEARRRRQEAKSGKKPGKAGADAGKTKETGSDAEKINREWRAAREKGQRLVDEFKRTLEQLEKTTDPAERAQLEEKLRRQAALMNESYAAKNILKAEGRTDAGAVFDKIVHDIYKTVDQGLLDRFKEMGLRRGGRDFTADDMMEFRNAASKGSVGMDRDYGLVENKYRELLDKLNRATPGSPEAQDLAKQLAEVRAQTTMTLDPEKYQNYLSDQAGKVESRLEELKSQLSQMAEGSEEARKVQSEIEHVEAMRERFGEQLSALKGELERAEALKQAKIAELQRSLAKVEAGSPEAQRIIERIEKLNKQTDLTLSPSKWNDIAQHTYNEEYSKVTGTDPEKAFQAVTTGKHKESYQDLPVLKNDPTKHPFSRDWAEQTASVSRVKQIENEHLADHGVITRGEAIQETARGYAKDLKTKLETLLGTDTRVSPEKLDMIQRIRQTLDDIGSGKIPPGDADAKLREAVPEIADMSMDKATRIADANLESAIKWRSEQPPAPPTEPETKAPAETQTKSQTGAESKPQTEGQTKPQTPDEPKRPATAESGGRILQTVFGRTTDLATVDYYYQQNLKQGLGQAEAMNLAIAQTAAGNYAMASGVADPRVSMVGGALLPQGVSSILPDQAVENTVGTGYQAGKAALQSVRDSYVSGQADTRALDDFAERVVERPGADPFKGIGLASQTAGELLERTDGGSLRQDLRQIYQTGAGSEVAMESASEFQNEVARGDHGVVLQGLDHVMGGASEVTADPVAATSGFVQDVKNIYQQGVGDGFWQESWQHTQSVLEKTPLVGTVVNGYNEVATGVGESGVGGFTQDMVEGGAALTVEAMEAARDGARSGYDYIRSFF